VQREDAVIESAAARWLGARRVDRLSWRRVARLAGGPVTATVVGRTQTIDPHAVIASVRSAGLTIVVAGSGAPIRALAQKLLGGPAELAASSPRRSKISGSRAPKSGLSQSPSTSVAATRASRSSWRSISPARQ